MKSLQQGSVLCIPLFFNYGYAYAKYIRIDGNDEAIRVSELIKVFDVRTTQKFSSIDGLQLDKYLIPPLMIAGVKQALKFDHWTNVGRLPIQIEDNKIPEFKSGNRTYEEIEKGEWFIHKNGSLAGLKTNFESVKFLQPFTHLAPGTIEMRLTFYHMIKDNVNIVDYLTQDETMRWNYSQVESSPSPYH